MAELPETETKGTIVNIARREQWEQERRAGAYRGTTLDAEGFIHCSDPDQVVAVANALYAGQQGLVLLCIDPARLQAELRYELAKNGQRYPHIYGPLNVDAVTQVLEFTPDGRFALPPGLA